MRATPALLLLGLASCIHAGQVINIRCDVAEHPAPTYSIQTTELTTPTVVCAVTSNGMSMASVTNWTGVLWYGPSGEDYGRAITNTASAAGSLSWHLTQTDTATNGTFDSTMLFYSGTDVQAWMSGQFILDDNPAAGSSQVDWGTANQWVTRPELGLTNTAIREAFAAADTGLSNYVVTADALLYPRANPSNYLTSAEIATTYYPRANPSNYLGEAEYYAGEAAGRQWGGTITATNGAEIVIAAGGGWVKDDTGTLGDIPANTTDAGSSGLTYVSWAETNLTMETGYNIVFWDASAGAFAQCLKAEMAAEFDFTRDFTVGRVYYDAQYGPVARLCGMNRWNKARRVQIFHEQVHPVEVGSGGTLGASSLALTVSAAEVWAEGENYFTTSAKAASDPFHYWYKTNSVWTFAYSASTTNVNATQYNDTTDPAGLVALTANKWRADDVYLVHDGSVHVVYGQAEYVSEALALASSRATPPDLCAAYGTLLGRVTVKKNATSCAVYNVDNVSFASASIPDHNDLANLQGGTFGSYYHADQDIDSDASPTWSGTVTGGKLIALSTSSAQVVAQDGGGATMTMDVNGGNNYLTVSGGNLLLTGAEAYSFDVGTGNINIGGLTLQELLGYSTNYTASSVGAIGLPEVTAVDPITYDAVTVGALSTTGTVTGADGVFDTVSVGGSVYGNYPALAVGNSADALGQNCGSIGETITNNGRATFATGKNNFVDVTARWSMVGGFECAIASGSVGSSLAYGYHATNKHDRSFVWSGTTTGYDSQGIGTAAFDPVGGASGFFIGTDSIASLLATNSATDQDYADSVGIIEDVGAPCNVWLTPMGVAGAAVYAETVGGDSYRFGLASRGIASSTGVIGFNMKRPADLSCSNLVVEATIAHLGNTPGRNVAYATYLSDARYPRAADIANTTLSLGAETTPLSYSVATTNAGVPLVSDSVPTVLVYLLSSTTTTNYVYASAWRYMWVSP